MALLNPGEIITCTEGHKIGEVTRPIELGQIGYTECVGNWRLEQPPQPGDPDPRCPCGARYWSWDGGFHIEGRGWSLPRVHEDPFPSTARSPAPG